MVSSGPLPVVIYRRIKDSRHHRVPLLPSGPDDRVGIIKLVLARHSQGETVQPGLERGHGKAVHLGLANINGREVAQRLLAGLSVQSSAEYTPIHLMSWDDSNPNVFVIRCASASKKRNIWITIREVAPKQTVVTLQSKVISGAWLSNLRGYVREDYVFIQRMIAEGFEQWPQQLRDDGIEDFKDATPDAYERRIPISAPPSINVGAPSVDLGTVLPHEFSRPCPHCRRTVEIDRLAGHPGGPKSVKCPHCSGRFTYYKAGFPG